MDTMAAGQYGDAKLMVSYGGEIQRSSEGGRPVYVGGDHRLVKVSRSSSLRELRYRLAAVAGCFNVALHYVCPDEPDALRDVVTVDDVRRLLNWVLFRDLQIQLYRQDRDIQLLDADPEKIIRRVRVFVVSMDVRSPLPESLFTVAPTTPIPASPSSPAPSARAPAVSPSSLRKRSASAPSLSACSADDTSKPPSPSLIQRSASASRLTQPSTTEYDTADPITTTTAAAGSNHATQGDVLHGAAPFLAMQRSLQAGPAPMFLVPVAPVILYHPVIPVYQGFLVPAGWRNVVVLCAASNRSDSF